jgi:PleD family two-component response regulator
VPREGLRPEDLASAADRALYRAKAEGRDRAVGGEVSAAATSDPNPL